MFWKFQFSNIFHFIFFLEKRVKLADEAAKQLEHITEDIDELMMNRSDITASDMDSGTAIGEVILLT